MDWNAFTQKTLLLVKKASLMFKTLKTTCILQRKDRYFFADAALFFTDGSIQDSVWKRSF